VVTVTTSDIDIRVIAPGLDADAVAGLCRGLRSELLDLDVEDVRGAAAGAAPDGAKSAEAIAWGALVVALAPQVAQGVMAVAGSWLSRQPADVEIEIDGQRFQGRVTKDQQAELFRAYLRRIESP
jgi:stage V sporulation protein SpoVS